MSAPEINGDLRHGPGLRLRYLAANFCRNIGGSARQPRGVFWQPPAPAGTDRPPGTPSPSRWLTEAFLRFQLPLLLPPGKIEVLDIGCGSGRACGLLAAAGYGGDYTGIDTDDRFTAEQWADSGFTPRHIQGDANEEAEGLGPFDLILSISALEHIADDDKLIRRFDAMLKPSGMQVHFLPAPAGLFVYLWHGYRQYGTRAIADRFGGDGTALFRLGGVPSFLLHLIAITAPEILLRRTPRRRWPGLYRRLLSWCVTMDRWAPFLPVIHVVCRRHEGATG